MKQINPSIIYPIENWHVSETEFDITTNQRSETIFTVGNGYIGIRGCLEENSSELENHTLPGTYINGFYETAPIIYGEAAYGYAKNHQTILNVPNALPVTITMDGEKISLFTGKITNHTRKIDFKNGLYERHITWTSPKTGKQIAVTFSRLVSFTRKHIAALKIQVIPINFTQADIKIESALQGAVTNQEHDGDPRAGAAFSGQVLRTKETIQQNGILGLVQETLASKLEIASGIKHSMPGEITQKTDFWSEKWYFNGSEPIEITKFISYVATTENNREMLCNELATASSLGFDTLLQEQTAFLTDFWETADIQVTGDDALQQALRFNAFHLLQSVGRDGKTNIAAKGVTGEGYEGHYFWDTEIFIFPFFVFTKPEIAKKLLEHRYSLLPNAKERARDLACSGALFPWRTINGEEASAYYPAGTAQIHINADIMHALKLYVEVTGDTQFLREKGLEMLIETSRFYMDYGDFVAGRGFVINGVTGPDEYTALINNNTYTNLMVKDQLEFLVASLTEEISTQFDVTDTEIKQWKQAAKQMYIHRTDSALIGQDDSFLTKGKWPFEATNEAQYPLLLHFHPMKIYQKQVLKQADLILAMVLQSERFTAEEKLVNYDYYEPLTTHDSSLSPATHAIIAAELDRMEQAVSFFYYTARTDLDDYHHNVKDGVHTAAMAGSWLAIVYGFAGLRIKNGNLHFQPKLPKEWTSYQFRITFQGRLIEVTTNLKGTTYRLIHGETISIFSDNNSVQL
ncbi:glycoside hydrolase family 65 protein [Listeria booriae]|uniref:glycoside hydrolase family 65 protein n=1 Tax=Listeria booriae TaxID=1552123 RepID=UPI0016234024|nr:glycoside hydrolase family 65 protein [Listeria booriae]MBC2066585.1 glycoside hydrolase family 65 protein [Listeria booriae]